MPVIPSFGAFAQTPNVAQSFLGGARIASDLSQHAATIQLQRAKLAQDAQQAEIEKSYHLAQIGLKERALKGEEEVLQFKVQEAAKMASAQMQMTATAQRLMDVEKLSPQEAFQRAMMMHGVAAGAPSGAFTQAMKPPQMEMGGASSVSGLPDNYRQIQIGPASRRIIDTTPARPAREPVDIEGRMERRDQRGAVQRRIDRLQIEADKAKVELEPLLGEKENSLNNREQSKVSAYANRVIEIEKLQRELEKLRGSKAVSPTATRTNRVGRFNIISN